MADKIYKVRDPQGNIREIKGPEGATDEEVIAQAQKLFSQPSSEGIPGQRAEPSFLSQVGQQVGNVVAGGLRGAGSIGATLIRPFESAEENQQRRAAMDAALASMGAQPDSLAYGAGKIGAEVAGTSGVGGLAAKGLGLIPGVAKVAPNMLAAIRSGGFSAGNAVGTPALVARMTGGAITGGASAGLVNPEEAKTGAIVGGALPVVSKGLSSAAKVMRGPKQSKQLVEAIESAREARYVVPPTQANASLPNRLIEGFAGKLTTAQNASLKNQEVTNKLAAKAIGLPETTELTPKILEDVRKTASQAYKEVASLPVVPAQKADSLMNIPASPEINPKNMVFDLRKARNDATAWFNSYARTADPESLAKAQAAKNAATELENKLEQYAVSVGREDLVPKMVEARQLIAKTWTVGKALNPSNGNVNAKVLAKELERGKPLSDELKKIAQFAGQFKTASQMPESMGSLPQLSPLDFATGAGLFAGTGSPLAAAGLVARPAARALALSPIIQNRLIQSPNQPFLNELGKATLYRSAPVAASQ